MLRVIMALFLISVGALAEVAPDFPALGEDLVLTQGKSAKDFFAERALDTECRGALRDAQAAWKAQPSPEAKDRMLVLLERCGNCATRPVEKRLIDNGTRRQVWYISDGSCFAEGASAASAQEGYQRARDSLREVPRFAHHSGGFDHMLEFMALDYGTGELKPSLKRLETFPQHFFVGLRGAEFLGSLLSYTQVIRADWEEGKYQGLNATSMRFTGVRAPRDFTPPEVYDILPSGRKLVASQVRLPKLIAAWYLHEGGYVRYFTAADFTVSLPFVEKAGRRMMLETVLTLSERAAKP